VAHIVTANCNDCKYTDCCVVCPVECLVSNIVRSGENAGSAGLGYRRSRNGADWSLSLMEC